MDKETKKPTSHFSFPPSVPLAMGVPFPMFHPQMRPFIPMGMMPVNSDMQQFMGRMTKSGIQAMIQADNLSSEQQCNAQHDTSLSSERTEPFLPPNTEMKKSLNSSQVGMDSKSEYTSHYPQLFPMMPSFVVFPYFGAIPGYMPTYPQFNPCSSPEHDKKSSNDSENQQNELKDDTAEENNKESGSDELDVAQILVNMHVPFVKHIPSSVLVPNPGDFVNQNANETVDEPSEVQDSTSPDKTQVQSIDHTSSQNDDTNIETDNHDIQHIETDNHQMEPIEKTVVIESESHEDDIPLDPEDHVTLSVKCESTDIENQLKETCKESDVKDVVLQIEVKTENEKESEVLTKITHNENELEVEENPSTCNGDVCMDSQNENTETKYFHELQCAKSDDVNVCSQPSNEEPLPQDIYETGNPSTSVEESNVITASNSEYISQQEDVTDVNESQGVAIEPETPQELANEDPSGQRMTYKCDVCSQLFRSPLGLQKHIEFHTDDGKHYTCSICFAHFQSDANLQAHLDSHMRKRPHKCSFCPKAFRDPGSLQKHVRVHTGEKPYNCKDCYRSFAEYSSLRKHQRVHTGEQPYKCQYCSKAFSISGNLQRHILIHTGERPYKCNFCPKAFNNPSHLRRHVKNLHFKGDSFVDEAMLSHYGNAGSKTSEAGSSSGDIEEALKQGVLQDANNMS